MRTPYSLDGSDRSYLLGDSDESATDQRRIRSQQQEMKSEDDDEMPAFNISPYALHPNEELSPRSHAWFYLSGLSLAGFFSALSMKSEIDLSEDDPEGQNSGDISASFILLLVVMFISFILSLVVTFSYHHRTYRDRLTDDFLADFSLESIITIILVTIWSVVQALQYVLTMNTTGLLLNCNCWIVGWLGFGLAIYLLGELLLASPVKMKGVYNPWKRDADADHLNDGESHYGHGRTFDCSPTNWTMLMAFGAALAAHSSALGKEDFCDNCTTSLVGFTTGLLCVSFSLVNLVIYRLDQMGFFDGWEDCRETRLLSIECVFSLLTLSLNGVNVGFGTNLFEHNWVEANVFVASWTSIAISFLTFERIANIFILRQTLHTLDGMRLPEEIHGGNDTDDHHDMRDDRSEIGRVDDGTETPILNQMPFETMHNSCELDLEAGEKNNNDTDSSTSTAQDLTPEENELLKALNAKAESYSSDTSNSSTIKHGKVIDVHDADHCPSSELELTNFRPISKSSIGGESDSTTSSPKTEPRVADPPGALSSGHSARNLALSANARRKRNAYLVEATDSMSMSRDDSSEMESSSTDHDSGPIVYTGPMNDDEISDIVGSIMSVHSTYSLESANTPSPMHETNILSSTNFIPNLPFNFTQSNKKKDHVSDASRLSALSEYSKESELNDESILKRSFGNASSQKGSYTEPIVMKNAGIPIPFEKDEDISEGSPNPSSSEACIQVGNAVKIAAESVHNRDTLYDDANRSLRDTPIPFADGSKPIASISGIEGLDSFNYHNFSILDESINNESPAITPTSAYSADDYRMKEIHTYHSNTPIVHEVSTDMKESHIHKPGEERNGRTQFKKDEELSTRSSASSRLNESEDEKRLGDSYTIPSLAEEGRERIKNDSTMQVTTQPGSPIPPITLNEEGDDALGTFPAVQSSNMDDLSPPTKRNNHEIDNNHNDKYFKSVLSKQEISGTHTDDVGDKDDTDTQKHSLDDEASSSVILKKEKVESQNEHKNDDIEGGCTTSGNTSPCLKPSGAYSSYEEDDIRADAPSTVEIYNLMLSSLRSCSDRQSVVNGSESGSSSSSGSPSSSSVSSSSSSLISSSYSSLVSSLGSMPASRESENDHHEDNSNNAISITVTPETLTQEDAEGEECDDSSDSSYFSTDVEKCGSYCDINEYGSIMSASDSRGSQEESHTKKESPRIKIPSDFGRESLENISPERSTNSCGSLIKKFGSSSGEDEGTLKTSIGDSAFESSSSSAFEIYHLMLESLKSCSDAQSYIEEIDEDEDEDGDEYSSSSRGHSDKQVIRRKLKSVNTKGDDVSDSQSFS